MLVALDADTFPITGFESMLDRVHDTARGGRSHRPLPHLLDFEFDGSTVLSPDERDAASPCVTRGPASHED